MEGPERDVLVSSPCGESKAAQQLMRSPSASCFNAFSRVDVRVDVKIPGGVDGEHGRSAAISLESQR